jgi:NAD(P)-dependent dehydrogenase (short-subunit alcohol dehydrogenase family)
MAQTIFITGASSGIGKATAQRFQQAGWNVAASMRKPEEETELNQLANVQLYQLDVTDTASIQQALEAAIRDFGSIDVLANNAGYGLMGPFEMATDGQIDRQLQVNLYGLMAVTRAILPHFRQQRSGVIVNISSIAGLVAMPLASVYNTSKFAVEGLSESLHYELGPLGIRVKVVEPGYVTTNFQGRSMDHSNGAPIADYDKQVEQMNAFFSNPELASNGSQPDQIAAVIFQAATDPSEQLRYIAGDDANQWYQMRQAHGDEGYRAFMRQSIFGETAAAQQ